MAAPDLFDAEHCVGVIYTKTEGEYTLRIHDHGKEIIPKTWTKEVKHFSSIESAKSELKNYDVDKAYLALDTTYDEFGALDQEAHKKGHDSHYDFMPISLE